MAGLVSGVVQDPDGEPVVGARVYSGIHFRHADEDGVKLGRDVARDGLERAFERD